VALPVDRDMESTITPAYRRVAPLRMPIEG
jgi:hypothetical protein